MIAAEGRLIHSVHTSVNTARRSACATKAWQQSGDYCSAIYGAHVLFGIARSGRAAFGKQAVDFLKLSGS
jgi:hypothetical protein